jgi:release factor glutamine methyltransferase
VPVELSAAGRASLVSSLRAAGCVYAEDEAELLASAASTQDELGEWAARRGGGEPLELVVGWAEFCGLRIAVAPGVFVPRRRSEALVTVALELLSGAARDDAGAPPVVVDLCCGSGAIAAALMAADPGLEVHAADVDPAAAQCARTNLARTSARVHVGDLGDALPASLRGRVSLLVANAPYVPTDEIALLPAEARDHEPRRTLDGGDDGVALQRRIAALAPSLLRPGGQLAIETSEHQAPLTATAIADAGLQVALVQPSDAAVVVAVGTLLRPP